MGLIALFWMGGFLFLIGFIIFLYGAIIYTILKKNLSKKLNFLFIILFLPILIIPLYFLTDYYQNNSNMVYIKGFFNLAPKTIHTIEFDLQDSKLEFNISLDFNTGARGGAKIDESFFYLKNGKRKEIILTRHEINMKNNFYKKALYVEKIANEVNNHKGYGNYYYDLYFNPKIFTIDEFEQICDFLKQNHEQISKKINNYKENQETDVFDKTRFRDAYYQDIKSLSKKFKCKNNLILYLTAEGRLFYNKKDHISTSFLDIGKIYDEGTKLQLNKYIKISKKNGKYNLYRFNTLISDCYNLKDGSSLFNNELIIQEYNKTE